MNPVRRISLACVATLAGMMINAPERELSGLSVSFGPPEARAVSKSPGGSSEVSGETSGEAAPGGDSTSANRLMEPVDLATEYRKLKAEEEKEAAKENKSEAEKAPAASEPSEEKESPPKTEGEAEVAPRAKDVYMERPKEYSPPINSSERAILEALATRRQQLDQQEQDMSTREKLLQAAEQRLDGRLKQLQSIKSQLGEAEGIEGQAAGAFVPPGVSTKSAAMPGPEAMPLEERPRFVNTPETAALVAVYENMSPKAAAAVFEKLDNKTILMLSSGMTPRKLSAIIAAMAPDKASSVTNMMLGRQQQQKRVVVEVEQLK